MIQKLMQYVRKLMQKGAFHIVVGNFLTKFVSFFGSVFLVRSLSKTEYGILSYYENFNTYFLLLAGLGLAKGIQRHMILQQSMPEKYGCYRYAMQNGTFWNVIVVILCASFCLLYPHPEAFQGYPAVIMVLTLSIPFMFLKETVLSALRALFDYKNYALLAFITSVLVIALRIIGAYLGGLNGTTTGKLMSEMLGAMICLFLIKWRFFYKVKPVKLPAEAKRDLKVYSVQMMLTDGLWAIFMLNDLFLLGQLGGNEATVADYKIAYVIPANLSILVSAVGVFVAPYFTQRESQNDYEWVRKKLALVLKVTSAVMGVAVLFCFILAKPLILLMYGKEYLTALPTMRVLLVASFFNNGVRSCVANVLSAMGDQKSNLYVAGIGIVLQIALDVYCIPRFGAIGLAFSSMSVYIMMSVLLLRVFYKRYGKKDTKA